MSKLPKQAEALSSTSRSGLMLSALALLAGCSAPPEQTATGTVLKGGGGVGEVQELKLNDGTRCAALIGYYKAAISCDWGRHD